ncbi:MAG: sugar transferase [Clostridiales bacterium]|nr:sugar transferase [Clostridiales bacterium]
MYAFVKRTMDILVSFFGLLILSFVLLIVAIAIKIDSKGPVIFKQQRVGKNGKVYNMYKFRSMKTDSEHTGTGVYSMKDDPRVTKVGKFIRATSIDELPQFINILKGDMSLIGPRPVLTYYPKKWEEYTEEELIRFNVRPGVTGWAAVHGRKTNTVEARFAYDNYYVENISFGLDFKIFLMTIKSVLTSADNEDITSGETENKTESANSQAVQTETATEEVAVTETSEDKTVEETAEIQVGGKSDAEN